jgi:hypothetical protein
MSKANEWDLLRRQFDTLMHDENVGAESIEEIFDVQFRRRFTELIDQTARRNSASRYNWPRHWNGNGYKRRNVRSKRAMVLVARMSAYDPKRTWAWFVTTIATAWAKWAKINHSPSNFRRRHCLSPNRSSIFIIYFHRLIIAFQETRERDLARAETTDETVSGWHSVCSLDRLQLPLAAARGGANVHLTGLLHENCSHYTDRTKASAIQARACDEG